MLLAAAYCLTFVSCDKDDDEFDDNNQEVVVKDVVVTVKEDGSVSGGHSFSAVDNQTFYIDYIKYSVVDSHLEVTGYDKTAFSGEAKIVSELNYKGNTYQVLRIAKKAFDSYPNGDEADIPGYNGDKILTSVVIPNTVREIGEKAFDSCHALKTVCIGNSLETIDKFAFADCSLLASINLPNSVTTIGYGAFYECTSLTSITLPNSLSVIEYDTFYKCPLTSVTIPNSVTEINTGAFAKTSLTSVKIPKSVTYICLHGFDYSGAFDEGSLSSFEVDKDNPVYSSTDGVLFNKDATVLLRNMCKKTGSYVIPNTVTTIGEFAFCNCDFTSVVIPKSVTKIEKEAFYCENLDVTCLGNTPPEAYGEPMFTFQAFQYYWNYILHVPKGCKEAYEKVFPWSNFKSIIEDAKE